MPGRGETADNAPKIFRVDSFRWRVGPGRGCERAQFSDGCLMFGPVPADGAEQAAQCGEGISDTRSLMCNASERDVDDASSSRTTRFERKCS